MRREKPPGRQKGARLFSMLLAVCLMIAALPLSVSAAGEYVPGNPRWSGYQNQVQWDRPAGAASGDSFEYEAQLLLGDDVVESKAVEIDTYLFFTNDVVTRPQEEYTIRVRARWIMIVGDPDGQYMVADVGEWGPWATKAGSGGGEAEPPHEHSYTQKHDAAQHWQSCGDKKDAADHSFGAWTADGNTESRTCTVCGYAETRDAAQTSATGETTDNGQDSGGEGIAELTDENTGVSVSLSEAVPEGVELYAGVMEAESLLEEKPELKEELDGLLSVYEISIRQNGEPVEIKDSAMTVRIPMNSHLEGYAHYQAVRVDGEPERIEAKAEDGSLVFEAGGPGRYAVLGSDTPFSVSAIIQPDPLPGDEKARYRRLSCWRCCLYSYTGKSGRHRITRQPEERIHPNRTAEIPKTDSTCKGENEDVSKKEFAGAAAVLMHGGRNTAGDSVCCGAICAGKSPLVGIRKPGNVG